jgi:DUF4097 and DUF4098 domain-containing protein YvlB
MLFVSGTSPEAQVPSAPGKGRTTLAVILLIVVVAAIAAALAALFVGQTFISTQKSFAPYQTPVSQSGSSRSSMEIQDVNGQIVVSPWSQAYLMINGTITARGVAATPDAVSFLESNSSGNIIFRAVFPGATFFATATYTININIHVPASAQFDGVYVTTVNGKVEITGIAASSLTVIVTNGDILASAVTASSLMLSDQNGNVDVTCSSSCSTTVGAYTVNGSITATLTSLAPTGRYEMTTRNGSVNLKLPASASCTITANADNGSVSSYGLSVQMANHSTITLGLGTAIVHLLTTNGSVVVTGT